MQKCQCAEISSKEIVIYVENTLIKDELSLDEISIVRGLSAKLNITVIIIY